MNPVGLGVCAKLLVATTFLVGTVTPSLASYMDDAAGQAAVGLCDLSFAPGNVRSPDDAKFTRQ